MYKVKNISKDPRRLKVNGKNVIIAPGEDVLTSTPPANSNIFEVKGEKMEKNKKEVSE
jgi:hypothetical protein